MAVTRQTITQRIVLHLGGHYGAITSGTSSSITCDNLAGYPHIQVGDLLYMPDAANASDMMREVSGYTQATGTIAWTGDTRTDTTFTSENFCVLPNDSPTLFQIQQAIDEVLRNARADRSLYVIPTADDISAYPLTGMSWLRTRDDIERALIRRSPGLLHNAEFDHWQSGTSSAPDGWTLTGSGASVARSTTYAGSGPYSVQLTRATNDATLTQNIYFPVAQQLIDDLVTVAISVRCQTATASAGRVGLNNGVSTTYSDYHSGDGEWETLTASITLTAAASVVQAVLSVDTNDATVEFDACYVVEGSAVPASLSNGGERAAGERVIDPRVENLGGTFSLLIGPLSRGNQIALMHRRGYAALTAETGAAGTTDAPEDLVVHGAVYYLASKQRAGQDRTRWDRLAAYHGDAYRRILNSLVQSAPRPRGAVVLRGA